ncbi:hypothetical protein LCGC14_0653920 [marine sediment metagenome]|uniref:Uncharacterized protein n=1 Tax=marine sediment metagenome TaxID=412755 RepID=A0A0F9RFH0_9ZZZZ
MTSNGTWGAQGNERCANLACSGNHIGNVLDGGLRSAMGIIVTALYGLLIALFALMAIMAAFCTVVFVLLCIEDYGDSKRDKADR